LLCIFAKDELIKLKKKLSIRIHKEKMGLYFSYRLKILIKWLEKFVLPDISPDFF
jgi:hypothetical protein